MRVAVCSFLAVLALALPASAQQATAGTGVAPSGDMPMSDQPTFVVAKWKAKLFGFVEFDGIGDTSQSFADLQGNGGIQKQTGTITNGPTPGGTVKGSVAGDNSRLQFSVRNTRLGFALESPKTDGGVKGLGYIESDFFGLDPAPFGGAGSAGNSEGGFYNNPTFRIRHAYVKIETPVIDVLAGQTWELFGWQGTFHPASVELQGLPGQIYSRTTQLRLTRTVDVNPILISIAAGAFRPPQRDSGFPDLQAGIKLEFGGWKGWRTAGGTATSLSSLSLGVSGLYRKFRIGSFAAGATTSDFYTADASAIDVGALIPIIPGTKEHKGNTLLALAEYNAGKGYNDLFTGLSGGVTTGAPAGAPATFVPNVDNGAIAFTGDLTQITPVQWRSFLANVQYYTPIDNGAVWLSAIYSDLKSVNAGTVNAGATTWYAQKFYSGNLFWDITSAVRTGASVSYTRQEFSDYSTRDNLRGQLSFWYLFL